MARVVAFVPDLLFGSNVLGALRAGGHDAILVSDEDGLRGELAGAEVLVIDLTADAGPRVELTTRALGGDRPRTLAFYSHVEADVRGLAESAGFDLVVPRSRMAREGPALVDRLSAE
jgi:hypothetical protein